MTAVKINTKKISTYSVDEWCIAHIGPRLYYLHNSTGGKNWQRKKEYLTIHEKEYITMLVLKGWVDHG